MKNKGFTLIELLAVIVILAIIALIATPIVLDIIEDSKINSNKRSIELYKNAVEQAFADAQLNGQSIDLGYYRGVRELVNGNTRIKVNYKGKDINCLIIQYTSKKLIIDKCEVGSMPKENLDEYVLKTEYGVEIGDYVNYDPTNGGTIDETYISTQEKNGVTDQIFTTESYKGKWQVLGVDNLGRIKLISSDIIEPTIGGNASSDGKYNYYQLKGEAGYINGVEELNNIGSLFAKGQYANNGRSVNLEDLTAISPGMDLNKVEHGSNNKMYRNSKTIGSYGYLVSYKYNSDGTKINYKSENGATMTIDANMFYHYDSTTKSFIRNVAADKIKTYTLKNNLNEYYPIKIYNVGNGELNNKGYRWYELLYRNTTGAIYGSTFQKYYVATMRDYVNPNGYNSYGIFVTSAQGFLGETLTKPSKDSNGNVNISESAKSYGIRAVVTLSSDILLIKETKNKINEINYDVVDIIKNIDLTNKICGNVFGEPFEIGSKYICDLGDGEKKVFYVLEDGDATTLTDGRMAKNGEVSLIMNSNIGVEGESLIEPYPKNLGKVAWCGDATLCKSNGVWDNSKGPITAINALNRRTEKWTKLKKNQISLPSYEQIYIIYEKNEMKMPMWLYDYLELNDSDHGVNGSQFYWTSSSYKENASYLITIPEGRTSWVAVATGWKFANIYISYNQDSGIRPVITISKSQLS